MSENEHAPLPMSLSAQLSTLCYADTQSHREIGRKAQVSSQTVSNLGMGKGSLRSFLQIMVALDRRIAIVTWEGKLLMPIENTDSEELICRALSYYSQECLKRRSQIGFEKLELSCRDVPINTLEKYLGLIHAHAVLVKVLGPSVDTAQVA